MCLECAFGKTMIIAGVIVAVLIIIYFAKYFASQPPSADGFADRFNEPAGYFAAGGGVFMDDIVPDDTKLIYGGKGGNNDFIGGCGCLLGKGKPALGITGMKTPYIANNSSVLDYKDFGAEYNVMNNSVGKGRAYLSPTNYMPEGTNLFFDGDMYVPPYSQYEPPLF